MLGSKGLLLAGALVLAAAWWGTTRASEVAIHSIVTDPAKFDHQKVVLLGSVADLRETTSHIGNDYTTFTLDDASGNAVTIFMWGHPDVTSGERVRVTGEFETEHRAGRYTFYNEVEASNVASQ